MSEREKTQADFDLETFVDLFDTAITSDNPAVKQALKNLLLIATMVQSETPKEKHITGPLRQVIDDIQTLSRRLYNVETQRAHPQTPTPTSPVWVAPRTNTSTGYWAESIGPAISLKSDEC